jgi:NodT family efflux transporter outer membrane factor (OMF) lipoprotein
MMNRLLKIGIPLAFVLIAPGCQLDQWAKNGMKVGPNYTTPQAAISNEWIDYQTAATQSATQPSTQPSTQPATQPAKADFAQWWRVFNDPVLNSLMHDANAQSLTLRAAGERIASARATRDIAIGEFFPQTQNLAGSHTVNKASNRTNLNTTNQWFQNVNAGFNLGWELDFWGRFRRAIEAADANLDASVADYDDVMVLLLSDVAGDYVQYRTFQQRLTLARHNVEIQRQSFELAQSNFKAGASTERDMQQARLLYEQTQALIPQFELGVRQSNNALCILLGVPTKDLSSRLGESGVIPAAPLEVAVGIPADLLRRRPDVRRAERQAAAQSALIGVAQSDLYPHFAINGSIGLNAEYIGGLWHTPGSMAGSFGPSFQWDILNYGRLENAVKGQEARFREFVANYEQTVLQADREVEDAIISFSKSKEREFFLSESVVAAKRTVQITYDQYRHGAVDFTPVFLFEQTLTQEEDSLAQSQGDIALSVVSLYRALGGGWEAKLQPGGIVGPPTTAPTTQPTPSRPDLLPPPPAGAATKP